MKRDKMKDMPYAWYWNGKPLRTGQSQGERIRPVCTGLQILQNPSPSAPEPRCCPPTAPERRNCEQAHPREGCNSKSAPEAIGPCSCALPRCCPGSRQSPMPCCASFQRHLGPVDWEDCHCDTLRAGACPFDKCCSEGTLPPHPCFGESCCPSDCSLPGTSCGICSARSELHCCGPTTSKTSPSSAPVGQCQQRFSRFESCDRFDCCEDSFMSKCEFSTEELETGHAADFESRSYRRRRPRSGPHRKYRV